VKPCLPAGRLLFFFIIISTSSDRLLIVPDATDFDLPKKPKRIPS
jgi:hypothetical protein